MLTIAICEDEKYILEELEKKVKKYIKRNQLDAVIQTYLSGEELLEKTDSFDIVLMDMKLPGISGLEAAKRLSKRSCIIFITSYGEYALDAFNLDAVHYLLKPVTEEGLHSALDRAADRLKRGGGKVLTLVKAGNTKIIPIQDILYCEVFNHQVCIHTAQDIFDYPGSLDMLDKELDERFFRCHRSFIVNMSCVAGRENKMAVLSNGDRIFIARRKQSEFMQRLLTLFKKEVI